MKKNYENNQLIISLSFIFLIISIVFMINLLTKNYRTFKNIDSIVISDKYLELIITDEDLKLLQESKSILIDNKKVRMSLINVERNVLKRNNISYHEVIIKTIFDKKYRENDYIKLTIYNKKEKIFNIFKTCWKEE